VGPRTSLDTGEKKNLMAAINGTTIPWQSSLWPSHYNKSQISSTLLGMLDPEDRNTTLAQNIGNYLPVDTAQHSTRLESSTSNKI
jgi:hypothetical protein